MSTWDHMTPRTLANLRAARNGSEGWREQQAAQDTSPEAHRAGNRRPPPSLPPLDWYPRERPRWDTACWVALAGVCVGLPLGVLLAEAWARYAGWGR